MTMTEIGALCRGFLLGLSKLEVNGLQSFTELLDSRRDPATRTRGLITGEFWVFGFCNQMRKQSNFFSSAVSNHISVYVRTGAVRIQCPRENTPAAG